MKKDKWCIYLFWICFSTVSFFTSCQKPSQANLQDKTFDSTMLFGKWIQDSTLVYRVSNFSGANFRDTNIIEGYVDIKANDTIYTYEKVSNGVGNAAGITYYTLNYIFDKNLLRLITSRKTPVFDYIDTVLIRKITDTTIVFRNISNLGTKEYPAYVDWYGHKK